MIDSITAEVVRNYLDAVAAEVYESMCRSSPNPSFNESKDAGAGVYAYRGGRSSIVARAGISLHSYSGLMSAQTALEFFEGDLDKGDILLVADSYHGGSHIGDYTIVAPIFFDGRPAFFTSVRGHIMDQGGPFPGGADPTGREIWHEGFRPAPLKLYEKGERRREVWNWLLANNRFPALLEADLAAMTGACKLGETRIREFADRYGLAAIEDSLEWIYDYSERKFRDRIRSWPDGTYRGEAFVDADFTGRHDLPIRVAVTIDGDGMLLDFAGTASQSEGYINSVETNTRSWAAVVFASLCPDIPINSGFLRALRFRIPEGTLANPRSPAPTAMGTVLCGSQIGQALMKACEHFAAEQVGTIGIDGAACWVFGRDERESRLVTRAGGDPMTIFADMWMVAECNGGAYGTDGWGAWSPPYSASLLPTIEMTEVQSPVHYHQAEFAPDSAAPGTWRGCPGVVARREMRGAAGTVANMGVQSLAHPLAGYAGGHDGAGNVIVIGEGDTGEMVVTESKYAPVEPSAVIYSFSGGGGGWGSPLDRAPEAVLSDVLDGYVSAEAARADYGVVIDPGTMTVDPGATERERAGRRDSPVPPSTGRRMVLARSGVRS
ncbi:hydantoinase B/oxoprolinase family protein [Amycolatopsis jejuensis]|uniref:hydantoinase B/oxoprolinase family protein n=1 Tax=Amycolatopsis jejuensis TaxID=330084 RepID=UPI0005268598|nr:hydantoinase B/oxoprolinase family protein [Amycolatopsis jejuensis]